MIDSNSKLLRSYFNIKGTNIQVEKYSFYAGWS